MMENCALCNEKRELKNSHIIPKFVGKWLKDTSATGFLRQVSNPDKREQDISKVPLLCGECEKLFNINETLFAEKIFRPFQSGRTRFDYDTWLLKFIISVQWRVIATQKETAVGIPDGLLEKLNNAFEMWREYLLGKSDKYGLYTHHVFFLDTIESASEAMELSDRPNMYLLRSIDSTIGSNSKDKLFIYTKLPGVIIWSQLYPENIKGWSKTRVYDWGTLKIPQSCSVEGFVDFLSSRMEAARDYQISDAQIQTITKSAMKNVDKTMKSRSYAALAADEKLK
ncbi:hypothetical protein COJ37_13360 [Bacillus cereus]|uniref:hypothetical protein n=2 Tax=Bacillus cereus TaxID=1396 RepID=UPI000BF841FC|nr:hypothetical protein [Bacillus cereus]PFM00536.1 hypothetical protein COJ37_13360 [Bacillus cereus]PFT68875.1 hypothetical protein COK73_17615 [Bacillus cereus]